MYFSWFVINYRHNSRIQESIDTLKSLKHDMKSHYSMILKLAKEAPEELNQYMEELGVECAKGNICTSNNVVLANAVNFAIQKCLEYGIEFRYEILTEKIPLTAIEQNIIYHNILLNAIESCERCSKDRNRFIKFTLKINNYQQTVIQCENSCLGVQNLATQKENKEEHGIGLKSIKKIIRIHKGKFFCSSDESHFQVVIIIGEGMW